MIVLISVILSNHCNHTNQINHSSDKHKQKQ